MDAQHDTCTVPFVKSIWAIARKSVATLTVVEEKRANKAKLRVRILMEGFRLSTRFLYTDAVCVDINSDR